MLSFHRYTTVILASLWGFIALACDDEADLEFVALEQPRTHEERSVARASSTVIVDGVEQSFGYHPFIKTGDVFAAGVFGRIVDRRGQPVRIVNRNAIINAAWNIEGVQIHSPRTDYTSILQTAEGLVAISHQEDVPGGIYITDLTMEDDGTFRATNTRAADLNSIHGTYNPCAGVATAWNTHLGTEEFEPDARFANSNGWIPPRYNDIFYASEAYRTGIVPASAQSVENTFSTNPYHFGWVTEFEMSDSEAGSTEFKAKKHYAMGRFSHEVPYVMPDQRTVYMTDDGKHSGFYMFIADERGDMSSGHLFAARVEGADGRGAGQLRWISLGHANNTDVEDAIEDGITFDDLMIARDTGSCAQDEGYYMNGNRIDALPDGTPAAGENSLPAAPECLRLKDDDPQTRMLSSRLETRRYASMLGATTEFEKMEGLAFDEKTNTLYVALASIGRGMLAEEGRPNDHLQLREANECGALYAMNVGSARLGTDSGETLTGGFVAHDISPFVAGQPDGAFTECSVDTIAGPDNLTFVPNGSYVIVAEDSGDPFRNDSIWAVPVDDPDKPIRIMTAPYGAELSSVYFYPDLNGYAYIMAVVQQPYGRSLTRLQKKLDEGTIDLSEEMRAEHAGLIEFLETSRPIDPNLRRAQVGVLGPIRLGAR